MVLAQGPYVKLPGFRAAQPNVAAEHCKGTDLNWDEMWVNEWENVSDVNVK